MKTFLKRLTASIISAVLVALAPGLAGYDACAQVLHSRADRTAAKASHGSTDLGTSYGALGANFSINNIGSIAGPLLNATHSYDGVQPALGAVSGSNPAGVGKSIDSFSPSLTGLLAPASTHGAAPLPAVQSRDVAYAHHAGSTAAAPVDHAVQNSASMLDRVFTFVQSFPHDSDAASNAQAMHALYEGSHGSGPMAQVATSHESRNFQASTHGAFGALPSSRIQQTSAGLALQHAQAIAAQGPARNGVSETVLGTRSAPVARAENLGAVSRAEVLSHPGLLLALAAAVLVVSNRARIAQVFKRLRAGETRSSETLLGRAFRAATGKLPRAFGIFSAAYLLWQIGSWTGAALMPLLAAKAGGPEFAMLTQLSMYAAFIIGNRIGAEWAKKYNSGLTFIIADATVGLSTVCIPIAMVLLSKGIWLTLLGYKIVFLLGRGLTGIAGGAVMGVAENEIVPKIHGMEKSELDRANAYVMLGKKLPGVIAPYLVGRILPHKGAAKQEGMPQGGILLAFLAAGSLFLSILPMLFVKVEKPAGTSNGNAIAANASQSSAPDTKDLPKSHARAYIFMFCIELAFFGLIGPIFALTKFKPIADQMSTGFVSAYSLGSFSLAVPLSLMPKSWQEKLVNFAPGTLGRLFSMDHMQWQKLTVAAWILFLGATFLMGNPALSLICAGLLGAAIMGAMVQWRTFIQCLIPKEYHADVFKKLFNWTIGFLIATFVILRVAPYLGVPLNATLVGVLSAVTAVVGIKTYWDAKTAASKKS